MASNRFSKRYGAHLGNPEGAPSAALKLLSLREAAAYAKVSVQTVRRWIGAGHVKTYRAGRQIRIHEPDLIQFLSGQ